ncbi:hypothetical protein ACQJBY_036177 [Aegilops geniculata]
MARRAPPPRRTPTGPAPPRSLFLPFSPTSVTESDHPAVGTMSSHGSDCRHHPLLNATSSSPTMRLSLTSTTLTLPSPTSSSPTAPYSSAPPPPPPLLPLEHYGEDNGIQLPARSRSRPPPRLLSKVRSCHVWRSKQAVHPKVEIN